MTLTCPTCGSTNFELNEARSEYECGQCHSRHPQADIEAPGNDNRAVK